MDKFDKESLLERQELLTHLARTKGFSLFLAMMQATAESAYRAMTKTDNPHEAAKHLGAHFTVTQLQSWLPRELEMIKQNLEQIAMDELTKAGQ